jgi:hypothetical protein
MLIINIAAASGVAAAADALQMPDSVYETPALASLVGRAAAANALPPRT